MKNNFEFDEIIPLVGNRFLNIKPTKTDKDIMLIKEDNNKFDQDAVAVYSKRNNKLTKLGYVIKDKNIYIRTIINDISSIKIIRSGDKNKSNEYYYYLGINIH